MSKDPEIIYSPLQQRLTRDGKTVEVNIYRIPTSRWNLEVVDEHGNSTVWQDEFDTDQDAFDQLLQEIDADGIDALIGPPAGTHLH